MAYIPAIQKNQQTTNATPVSIDIPAIDGIYVVRVYATSGDNRKAWQFSAGVKNISGTAGILGTVQSILSGVGDLGLATATAVVTANAGNLRITLTGILATTIDWKVEVKNIL